MNTVYNLGNRKRFSFLIFTVFVTVAMFFATAPAATAQVVTPSVNGALNFDDNDVVCFFVDRDDDRIRCVRVGERDNNGPLSQEFSERRIRSGAASPSVRIANSGNNVNLCPTVQQIVNTGNVANEQGIVQYGTDNNDRFPFGGDRFGVGDGGTIIVGPTQAPTTTAAPDPGLLAGLPGFIAGYASRLADPSGGFIATPNGVLVSPDRQFFIQPNGVLVDPGDRFLVVPHDRFRDFFDDTDDINFEGSSINIDGSASSECTQTINQAAAAAPAAAPAGVVATAGGAVAAAPAAAAAPAPAPMAIAGGGGGVAAKAAGGMLPKTGGAAGAPLFAAIAGMLLAGGGLLAYRRFRS